MTILPKGWSWSTVGELTENLDRHRRPISAAERARRPGDVPYYGAAGQVGTIEGHLFDEHLLLLGEDGIKFFEPQKKKAYLISGRSWVNNHAHVLRVSQAMHPGLLEHYLDTFDYVGYATGTTRLKLTKAAADAIPVPVPPHKEQQRIMRAVDECLAPMQAAEQALHTTVRRLAQLNKTVLRAARTAAIQQNARFKSLGDISETALGKMLDARRDTGTPTPYVGNINVRWGSVVTTDLKVVPLEPDERLRFSLRRNDVLICEGGEPGRCAVWNEEDSLVCYQKALHRVRVNEEVIPEWLVLMLTEAVKGHRINSLLTGTTIKHLPQEQLRRVQIPVPSIADQRSILLSTEASMRASSDLQSVVERQLVRSRNLTQELLRAAVRGELVDQDPTDEPADILLARIRTERDAAAPASMKSRKPRARKATSA